jgi:hypothetical protein
MHNWKRFSSSRFVFSAPIPGCVAATLLAAFATNALAAIPGAERNALIALYNSTGGDQWTDNANWCSATCPASGAPTFNTAGTECNWYGVGCDSTKTHVVAIALASNSLSGTLPSIGALTNLQYFNVSSNQLGGTLPNLSGLSGLREFYADDNLLSGSVGSLSGLTNLGDFSVRFNALTGAPPSVGGLTNLYSMAVTGNALNGLFSSIAGLAKLESFEAGDNRITGFVPGLSGLGNLLVLTVDHNLLTGSLPSFSATSRLHHFDAGGNNLSGAVPTAPASLYVPLAYWPSVLCANSLTTTASGNDAGWNVATGFNPWWATPYASNKCDDIFTDRFGP